MHYLPRCEPQLGRWVPLIGELFRFQQPDAATTRLEHSRLLHASHTCVFGARQYIRNAELAFCKTLLLEPRKSPACFWIKIALLFSQRFIERLINDRKRLADRKCPPFGTKHLLVASINCHARSNCRLSKIHWGNVATL